MGLSNEMTAPILDQVGAECVQNKPKPIQCFLADFTSVLHKRLCICTIHCPLDLDQCANVGDLFQLFLLNRYCNFSSVAQVFGPWVQIQAEAGQTDPQ